MYKCGLLRSVVSDSLQPHNCSPPGYSVLGISQARILTCVAISYSRGSSLPRDWTCNSGFSCTGRWIHYHKHHQNFNTIFLNLRNSFLLEARGITFSVTCILTIILKERTGVRIVLKKQNHLGGEHSSEL